MQPIAPAAFRTPMESATLSRVAWLIAMRWLFVLGILAGAWLGSRLVPDFHSYSMLGLGLFTALFNTLLHLFYVRLAGLDGPRKQPIVAALIQLQVLADWLVLLALIHYTGGIESPLLHFFIFHLALSAVFLSPAFTVFALLFIVTATSLLFTAEAHGLLTPVILPGLTDPVKQHAPLYIAHFCFWYFSTLAVMALLLGSVMRGLRRREQEALRIRHRLEQVNQDLTRLGEERIRLMHTMGHELRSPIAAAQSMLSALDLSLGADLPAPARTIHQRIRERLKGLTLLIGELLELAEQRRGAPALAQRRIELGRLLLDLVEEYRERALELGLELQAGWDPGHEAWVGGEPERLRRVFENLLSNAVKYSRAGGVVRVDLTVHEAVDGSPADVEVSVADQGIGIAPDQLPRLFQEFYRTPQSRRHTTQGTGLGLAITKDLVETAGGRLTVESVLDQGSTFRVWLPALPAEGPSSPPFRRPQQP
jgi:signal transduction histidine kinase